VIKISRLFLNFKRIKKNDLKKINLDRIILKRKRFVLVSALLTVFLVVIQIAPSESRFFLTAIFGAATYVLFWFGLWEDIKKIEWLTLFALPVLFSITISLWYFLLPVRWISRLAVAIPYGVIIYFLLLTENIYNVAVARTIQLLRVARTVGSFISLLTAFLFFWTLTSFDLLYAVNGFFIFIFCFLIFFSFFWSFELDEKVLRNELLFSLVFAFCLSQIGWVLSFWPVEPLMETLFLSAIFYSFLGLGENYFLARPVFKSLRIYFFGILGLLILMIVSTSWG